MFRFAPSFNGDISQWDVGDVQNMYAMFYGASLFNSDISEWRVFSVTNMHLMFSMATSFNGVLSRWDVSRVTNMDSMFWEAISFKQKLCGDAWVHSTASKKGMFTGSRGSISREVCTFTTRRQDVTRRPLTERELQIVRASITTPVSTSTLALVSSNTIACLKCGMFKKSGRVSCCAPGGTWYKDCGGADNRNADPKWFEGVEACKFTTTAIGLVCLKCGTVKKSGKISCC